VAADGSRRRHQHVELTALEASLFDNDRDKDTAMTHRIAPLYVLAFAALGAATAFAQAPELPTRKAGLWEITMKSEGSPTTTNMQQCTDEATDKAMNTMFNGPGQSVCTQQSLQKSGNTITIESTCAIGNMKTASRAVFVGDFNSAYTVQVASKSEGTIMPGMPANGESKVSVEAKWAGPCKAEQKPGDMVMPGGIKMNIADLQKFRNMMGPQGGGAMAPRGGMMAPGGAMAPKGGMMAPQK
jgi:hypothetical protein